jgi:hypothetical protein
MRLINIPTTPPEATELVAQGIVDVVNTQITHRVAIHNNCFITLWLNTREGFTLAAVLATLGTKAVHIMQFANKNRDHIVRCANRFVKTRADFITDTGRTPPEQLDYHANVTVTLA